MMLVRGEPPALQRRRQAGIDVAASGCRNQTAAQAVTSG
jgi:hypothetical protein